MAFGSGVLLSALSFNLTQEAYKKAGLNPVMYGFFAGALLFTIANVYLASKGGKNRKRSDSKQVSEKEHSGSGMAIAVGSLMDDIPESIVIGLSLIGGGAISMATVIAIFISDIPEALSSATGMRKAGRSKRYIFGIWGAIAFITGISALIGYAVFSQFPASVVAAATAFAAGGILAMVVDTMIPEAFNEEHNLAGIIAVIGFLLSFMLTKIE